MTLALRFYFWSDDAWARQASANQTLAGVSQTASVQVVASASAAQTLGDLAQTAAAAVVDALTASQTLATVSQSNSSQVLVAISAAQALEDLQQSATSTVVVPSIGLAADQLLEGLTQFNSLRRATGPPAGPGLFEPLPRRLDMPVVSSETEICNIALTRIGHTEISALTEASKAGRLCNRHYGPTRDSVLRAHPWNFAIARATLAQRSFTPDALEEFLYRYVLPTDCLKVIRTDLEAAGFVDVDYRVEGREIATNEASCYIEYIAQITDVTQFDALFVDALAQRLAAELCIPITDNASAAKGLWEVYDLKLREARGVDGQEGIPRDIQADGWLNSRF